jgi:opacity protein-like surface antigen
LIRRLSINDTNRRPGRVSRAVTRTSVLALGGAAIAVLALSPASAQAATVPQAFTATQNLQAGYHGHSYGDYGDRGYGDRGYDRGDEGLLGGLLGDRGLLSDRGLLGGLLDGDRGYDRGYDSGYDRGYGRSDRGLLGGLLGGDRGYRGDGGLLGGLLG